jgi:hypothetical protein
VLAGSFGRGVASGSAQEKAPVGRQAKGIRRIVTGHNASGKAVVLSEQEVDPLAFPGLDATETSLWSTERVPADNTENHESAASAIGSAMLSGSAFRIISLAPGCTVPMRRGPSIDYCMLLSGSVDLILDEANSVTLSTGDTAVLRGTSQAWRNPSSDTPCKIAISMIEARPMLIAGKLLCARSD